MWKCTNCSHLELRTKKPAKCPVCGANSDKLAPHEVAGIKGEKTLRNLKMGFVAESQASVRNQSFALNADMEGFPQMATLFRAVAESEAVHAYNHLQLLNGVSDTQQNLASAFERENLAADTYPELIKDAIEEGNDDAACTFGFVRDVEKEHAKLYARAMDHMVSEKTTEYYVCSICGHIEDGSAPENCPICGAPENKFRKII
jgi:rubrerythrin